MAGKGLFAVSSAPADDAGDDDYSGDALPAGDETDSTDTEPGGPFDAYAETVFDAKADVPTKTDALRQAIETILEEHGHGSSGSGGPSVGGVLGKLGLGGG